MRQLAFRSLRTRASAFGAAFLSVFFGRMIIGTFAILAAAGYGDVSAADADRLRLMGTVVGSWGAVIVLFSVASTLGLVIGQRQAETSLLRAVGATPGQVRRLVLTESVLVTVAAVVLSSVPAAITGDLVLAAMRNSGMIDESVGVSVGARAIALAVTGVVLSLVCLLAGILATRRTAKASASIEPQRMSRWRWAAGILLTLGGIQSAVITVTVTANDPDPLAPMSTAGPACVFTSIGLATLAPALLKRAATWFAFLLRPFGAAGHLAEHDLRARAHLLGSALAPIIVFAGISTGTAYLVAIENAVSANRPQTAEAQDVELLNYVVVGMIALFAAIMVVNTLAAAIADRRPEFGRQQLAGATKPQIRLMMRLEAGFLAGAGIGIGALASSATVVSYSWVKQNQVVPGPGPWYFLGVAAVATVVTVSATRVLTRKALSGSALTAVAGNQGHC